MEIPPPFHQLPADPKFVDQIVNQIKSQGTFDQWRRECLADVDTKPAYQNLTFRVDSAVAAFLGKQRWRPDMAKNQVRENLRKHILELGLIDKGVDRIVQQVVQPKVLPIFHPAVENAIYNFLGIQNPRIGKIRQTSDTSVNISSPRKAFRPMPVSIPSRDKEDCTPPPGEEFDLEAITPSPESVCQSALNKHLAGDMSDVSVEDSRPAPESGLERICSPISPQSSRDSVRVEDAAIDDRNRVGSALSAISSGDDIPSESPAVPSPITSEEFRDNNNPLEDQPQNSQSSNDENDEDMEEDEEDDFSSPEFEKLEINAPTSRTVTPIPGEEEPEEKHDNDSAIDDHYLWRPKISGRDPDRKPDEDPGNLSSKKTGEPSNHAVRSQPSESGSKSTGEVAISDSGNPTTITASTIPFESSEADKMTKDTGIEASASSSSKERSRSKSESHKSDRREKSYKDKDRDRDRDRRRDREKRREREKREESERRSKSHHSKSGHKDRDERKKSSHRDKERERRREKERDRNRSKSSHEADRYRSNSHKDRKSSGPAAAKNEREPSLSPLPTLHPKAYLWKRPEEKPNDLWDYLARFSEKVFDEMGDANAGLSDVSVSSVSSYEDSDSESILLCLSEVEVDSEVEKAFVHSGGRVFYRNNTDIEDAKGDAESDFTPASDEFTRSESCLKDQQLNINNNKRVRKLNTRYSDSYVTGSELRKIITTQNSIDHPQRSPRLNNNSKSLPKENQENCIQVCPSEEIPEREQVTNYQPSDAKRMKMDQPLPSSPESVQSDLTHHSHVLPSAPPTADVQSAVEEDASKETISPNGRRKFTAVKQPQQRYDDADLYKPRPVITPSSRRSRRHDDS